MAPRRNVRKMRHMRRAAALLIGTVCIALAATAGTARAGGGLLGGGLLGGGCGSLATVFSPWDYLAGNGGFESGSTGWSLSGGASVVNGNEPFSLSGRGAHSLSLPAGASASINVCYGLTYPAVRFVVAGDGGSATVHVRVVSRSLLGVLSILDGGTFQIGPGWNPAPKLSTLFSALASPLGSKSMTLIISSESGQAQIDDLYVDPFLMKG
jgi:hypothetical protein